jgi:hypothetical protein
MGTDVMLLEAVKIGASLYEHLGLCNGGRNVPRDPV